MKFIKVSDLLNTDSFLIECIRIWIKSMVYDQNPIEVLKKLLNNYGIKETAISLDDFMGCIALSSVKKYDFRITNCQFVGNSEKDILMILYYFQNNNPLVAGHYVSQLIDQKFYKFGFESSKLISKDLLNAGLFLENPLRHLEGIDIDNIINYDFKKKQISSKKYF